MNHNLEKTLATDRYTQYRCTACGRGFRVLVGTEVVWLEDCGGEMPAQPEAPPPIQRMRKPEPPTQVATREERDRRYRICGKCDFEQQKKCAPPGCSTSLLGNCHTGRCLLGFWRPELPAIAMRHLIYHVYPRAANDAWRENFRQLAKRWAVFNGRRIISIATGEEAESPATVRACLRTLVGDEALGVEWLEVEDSEDLREVASFPGLLRAVTTTDPGAAVFFGHSKGVSPWGTPPKGGIAAWRDNMYAALLDDPARIGRLLRHWPCVGACKIIWRKPGETPPERHGLVDRGQGASPYPTGLFHGDWMFSGTFWWVRCDSLFGNWRWPFVPHDHYGAEAYLSGIFPASEAFSVYQPWPENEYPVGSSYHPKWHKEAANAPA